MYNLDKMIERAGKPIEFREILLKERRRQITLRNKVGRAYEALRPILEELATHGPEWPDSDSHFKKIKLEVSDKNQFVVEGDNDATYRKAAKFLLQKEGNDLFSIASVLLGDTKIGNMGYDEAVTKIENLIRKKIDSHAR